MGVVFIRRIVGVNDLGAGSFEDGFEIIFQGGIGRAFHRAAGVAELEHRRISADQGGGVLFLRAYFHHGLIGDTGIRAGAGTACAVGAGDAAEPFVPPGEAFEDAVEGHEFEIVLMGSDPEMGNAR